jgi:hypothetical protein
MGLHKRNQTYQHRQTNMVDRNRKYHSAATDFCWVIRKSGTLSSYLSKNEQNHKSKEIKHSFNLHKSILAKTFNSQTTVWPSR